MALITCEDEAVTVEVRDASPSHYLMKFESFSKLSENGIDKYESNEFEAFSYKWRMIIYPNGDDSIEGNDYISVYLAVADSSSLAADWEANAMFSFFLFNQLCDNYLVIRGQVRRFHKIKSQWGCSKFISHKSLKEPSNGYLVDDNCILGAEVFVIKNQGVGECVSLLEDTKSIKHEWKIFEFSKLGEQCFSKEFTVGDHKWKIQLYPNGSASQRDQSISIFLRSVDATGFGCRKRVKAKYTLIKDQINGAHREISSSTWFSAVSSGWGYRAFLPLREFKDPKRGFLVKDCCIVEADVSVICVVNGL